MKTGQAKFQKTHKGRYPLKNPSKYQGDPKNVIYRSGWERAMMTWLDLNPDVLKWQSEEFHILYQDSATKEVHRYFPDFKITFTNGNTVILEIKPKKEVLPPKKLGKSKGRYLQEVLTYSKNQSKWLYANAYAKKHGWVFLVWTEETLRKLRILKG